MHSTTIAPPPARPRRRGERRDPSGNVVGLIHARLSPGLAADVRVFAAERGEAISAIVERALREFLDREDERERAGGVGG